MTLIDPSFANSPETIYRNISDNLIIVDSPGQAAHLMESFASDAVHELALPKYALGEERLLPKQQILRTPLATALEGFTFDETNQPTDPTNKQDFATLLQVLDEDKEQATWDVYVGLVSFAFRNHWVATPNHGSASNNYAYHGGPIHAIPVEEIKKYLRANPSPISENVDTKSFIRSLKANLQELIDKSREEVRPVKEAGKLAVNSAW